MGTDNYFKGNNYKLYETFGIGYDLRGREFYFSIEDYDLIKQYTWNVNPSHGYVICSSKNIRMHRLIMGEPNCKVDHINLHKNDNRRENLRLADNRENNINRSLLPSNTSGYSGVSFNKNIQKWNASVWLNYIRINLGYFVEKQDAINARLQAEQTFYGKYSRSESKELAEKNKIKEEECVAVHKGGNPSGYVGINWNKNSKIWCVYDGAKYLTHFNNLQDAIEYKNNYNSQKSKIEKNNEGDCL